MSKGFTLVELLLVIAILAIIAYFSITYFGGYESKTSLDSATSEISSYLQQARSKSMAQEKGKAWGVKFDSDEKGHFYQIQSSDEVYSETKRYLPAGITFKDFTPPQKIQFTKLYGSRSDVSTISTIELVSFKLGTSKSVNVNEEGRIYVGHIEEEEAISCTLPEECESGFCVDGYCCNSACEGTCEACNLAGNLGTCTTRPADDNTECGTCERCDGINTFCQYVSSGQQGKNCTTICYACDDLGFCVAQTVDYAAATALGCTLGAEACRKCTAGTCGYYTSGQHGCSAGQQCNASGECETSYECIKGADCPADKYCQESTHSCQTTPVCQLKVADGYGTTNVTDNTQVTGCNGTCQACQSGSCGNANVGTDPGEHCSCTNYIYGWSNNSCKKYSSSTSHNGMCKSDGTCYTAVPDSCTGAGETTITCGSSECKKACPQNGAVVDYDEMDEVCYTSGQQGCPEGYECNASGQCAAGWVLNETNCNALFGWHWYNTNGRRACWSETLADFVSWNKGAGDNTRVTGSYTCTPLETYDLQTRMIAAATGEWYKIVSEVAGTTITVSHRGQSGASVISALAISDCVDGTKDLVDCNKETECTDWSTTNTWLRTWAGAAGKSALPYCANDGCTRGNNDYRTACDQNSGYDVTIGDGTCTNNFYLNRKVCNDGDTNYSLIAACGFSEGYYGDSGARLLGYYDCISQCCGYTSYTDYGLSFRVVVRP